MNVLRNATPPIGTTYTESVKSLLCIGSENEVVNLSAPQLKDALQQNIAAEPTILKPGKTSLAGLCKNVLGYMVSSSVYICR